MKDHQTPRKDLSHRRSKDSPSSKAISDQSKKPQKNAKKNLNAEFSSVSEDLLTGSVTESFNFSPVSEVLSDNNIGESLDSLECLSGVENYSLLTLEEALTPSDFTSSFKITTVNEESTDLSVDQHKTLLSNDSFEAESVVVGNLLKQARLQVLRSNDIHPGLKKLLDALVEVSLREFYALPVERERIDVIISNRGRILVFCFVAWVIISIILIVFCRGSGARSSASFYPPPT